MKRNAVNNGTRDLALGSSYTGIAIYTGVNDFYQPLREILHPPLRLFTPLYAPLQITFCKTTTQISDHIDLVLALSRSRSGY
jgi:hypothetical protein